jgi:hypothetical protein
MNSEQGTIKNIERIDSKEKLFKSAEIGGAVSGHTWAEVKLSDGRWIPVDPSTKLVGDTPENLEMFRQANYMAIGYGLDAEGEPSELSVEGKGFVFRPGESQAESSYHLYLKSTRPTLRFSRSGGGNIPPTNTPFSGEAKMNLKTGDTFFGMKLNIVDVKAA